MLRYLTHAIGLNHTWKLIKPHVHSLLTKCVFDLMCFDDEDAELWEEDPQEYIRKVVSPMLERPKAVKIALKP